MKESKQIELLSDKNSMLLLVDFQPLMFHSIGSGDRTYIKTGAIALAKSAQILEIPAVLSAISPKINEPFLKEISELFRGNAVVDRTKPGFDALEDKGVFSAVKKTGRQKIVMAGLWTSMCFAFTALRALSEGYEVYGVMDIVGDATKESHRYGVKRMIQAGVVPVTWMSVVSEWIRGWDHPKAQELSKEVYSKYDAELGFLYGKPEGTK
jgi:nicotinamidase-related amidase